MTLWDNRFGAGPMYGWGGVPHTPRAGVHGRRWYPSDPTPRQYPRPDPGPGEWRWQGHGPDSWGADYGWEYRGGRPGRPTVARTEAEAGPRRSEPGRFAEERGGGLPRGRERYDADRWFSRPGEGRYDRGYRRYDQGW